MRIDLHTHSLASDGTDTPGDLVRAAAAGGLDVVGITDHDTDAGWAQAAAAAEEVGIALVRGMEISTRHRGRGVHLLAYLPDPTYPELAERLRRIVEGRGDRIPAMLAQLAEVGVHLDAAAVHGPETGPVGRPHVGDALVRAGYVETRTEAFARYLDHGRPGYVDRYAPSLSEMIDVVDSAGGATVIAHAWGRHGPEDLTPDDLGALARRGLAGLEVDHQDHDTATRVALLAVAREHDLVVTGSSDYHGTGKVDHDLGCHLTDSRELDRLLERAADAAARSGRAVPSVVGPVGPVGVS